MTILPGDQADRLWWLGVALVAGGAAAIYWPLGPIVGGAACILLAVGLVRRV